MTSWFVDQCSVPRWPGCSAFLVLTNCPQGSREPLSLGRVSKARPQEQRNRPERGEQGWEMADLIPVMGGWPDGWGRPQTGSRQQDQRQQVLSVSCFVLAPRGSAAQQFQHEFCFLHSYYITSISSHFNLGMFSKPGPLAGKIVYQRSHLSVLL